jgi:hypothetical protein
MPHPWSPSRCLIVQGAPETGAGGAQYMPNPFVASTGCSMPDFYVRDWFVGNRSLISVRRVCVRISINQMALILTFAIL